MVRSEGETPNWRELFHLVQQIRAEIKYFNVSRAELVRKLDEEKHCEVTWEHETTDEDGSTVFADLRLNFAARRPGRWAVSLKLHRIRIDGVDWYRIFDLPDGTRGSGWHRHEWDPGERKASHHVPLPTFDDKLRDTEDFVVRVCEVMRIQLSTTDVGSIDTLHWD